MLQIDILENKRTRLVNGEEILDLTTQSVETDVKIGFSRLIMTTEEHVMRPDLISAMYCGNQRNLGTLLKVNSISNPFSIDSNEVLFIPDSDTVGKLPKKQTPDTQEEVRKSFRKKLQERISKVSEQRKEYLNSVNISQSTVLPPNVAPDGAEQFKVENGKLIFGADIGVCRTKIQQNRSVATIKSRFAQRQIFES